jgi:hypothetical protein
MITNYSQHRPGISIKQQLAADTTSSAPDMAACIIGPKCLLNRYGRETIPGVEFNAAGQALTFQRLVDEIATTLDLDLFTVDQDTLKLYGVGLEASLATYTAAGTPSFKLADLSEPNVIALVGGATVKGAGLETSFRGRPVQIGDVVYCEGIDGGTVFRRTVTGFRGVVAAGSFGANLDGDDSLVGNVAANPVTTVADASVSSAPATWAISCAAPEDFNGLARGAKNLTKYGEEFVITVHTAGDPATATVNIASTSGLYNATNVATVNAAGNFSITDANAGGELGGVDLVITPPAPGTDLTVGMSFRITVLGNYSRLGATQVIAAGTYTGVKDTVYMIRVTQPNTDFDTDFDGAKVTITDTAGIDTPQENVTITDGTARDLGNFGLTIEFDGAMPDHGGLRVGDVYFVRAVAGAVSTTNFDRVVLSGPAVDTLVFDDVDVEFFSVEFRAPFTGEIATDAHSGGLAWTGSASALTVEANLDYYVADRDNGYEWRPFVTGVGELQSSYRAFYAVDDTNGMVEIAAASDLVAAAGVVDLDNPLGYAAQQALLGADGKAIWVLNTGGTTLAAFETALATIENTRIPYDLCILSTSQSVGLAALVHAVAASAEENLSFRRVRIGLDSPGEYVVLEAQADTTNFTCTVSPHGGGNKLVTISAGADEALLTTRGLTAGDLLKLTATTESYAIAEVLSDTELLLSTGPASEVDPAVACQIWKADTVANQKAWLIAQAAAYAERRASLVWVERGVNLVNGATTVIPTMFGAAYLSGLRSNLKPQIGMTRQTVATFTAASRMYSRYSRADLDDIAAAGIQILEQTHASAPVRVRHQATTDTSNGILNYEESTTVRFDYLSFLINNTLDSSIGRVNTTEQAVEETRAALLGVLNAARLVPVGANYGPLLDDFTNLVVQRSTSFLDRIEASVDVEFGPPTNRQAITITAYGQLPAA